MKYAIVLPDGAADQPLAELGGRTPLEAADTPHMDWVARHGRTGCSVTVPPGFIPGTDVATLSLFGYEPASCYAGRAPIEAAAQRLPVAPHELVFRCNFVTILEGRMRDFTADHIAQAEAERLVHDLNDLARRGVPALRGCVFHAGVSYRNLMIAAGTDEFALRCAPPHDIPNQPVADHLPVGRGQERARAIMAQAAVLLRDHELNAARRAAGRPPITDIWLWGQGQPRPLPSFHERFGLRGAVITGVDIIRGLAVLMGMDLLDVPGVTGYLDTDYAAKGRTAAAALRDYDLVAVHVEAPDEAAHQGSATEKVTALQRTDADVVRPLLEALRTEPAWRILIAPDHETAVSTTAHSAVPPPFCFAGTGVAASGAHAFSERQARAGGWLLDPGTRLIREFLGR